MEAEKKLEVNRQGSRSCEEWGCKSQEEELGEEADCQRGARIAEQRCMLFCSSHSVVEDCSSLRLLSKDGQELGKWGLDKRGRKQMDKE